MTYDHWKTTDPTDAQYGRCGHYNCTCQEEDEGHMRDHDVDEALHRSDDLVATIAPILHGQGVAAQGAALSYLCAMWIAGHHPDVRPEVMANFLKVLVRLIAEGGFAKEPMQ